MHIAHGSAGWPALSRRSPSRRVGLPAALPLASLVLFPIVSGCSAETSPLVDEAAAEISSPGSDGVPRVAATNMEEAGRYIAVLGGCNDCHTEGYLASGGTVPEEEWLTGSAVGFRGPWGTTYPANLRRTVERFTEDQWVTILKERTGLPPMPWMNVNQMTESDSRALYRYIRSLGPAGDFAAAPVPPDQDPTGPWIDFVPRVGPRSGDG